MRNIRCGPARARAQTVRATWTAIALVVGVVVGNLAVGVGVDASPAGAATKAQFGYVWADNPTSPSYTPAPSYQANSTNALNTITRSGVGVYLLRFPGLAPALGAGGTVDVTAYATTGFCKVANWYPNHGDLYAGVRCFTAFGAAADSSFDAAFVNPGSGHPKNFAYVWADQPTSANYSPSAVYQYNSGGGTNTITRSAVGSYSVSLPDIGLNAGTVKVTGYGTAATTCQVGGWSIGAAQSLSVSVYCRNAAGQFVDDYFTMTWVDKHSLLGIKGHRRGYVWANSPTATSYTPSPTYQENSSGALNTITRSVAGNYAVAMPNLGATRGHVEVTTYGSTPNRCVIAGWAPSGSTQIVKVACYTITRRYVDAVFTVQYVE